MYTIVHVGFLPRLATRSWISFLEIFFEASDMQKRGFHRATWDVYCLLQSVGGMGIFYCWNHEFALCAKWIIRALEGIEAWKILIRHCISTGLPFGRKSWKDLNLQTLLTAQVPIKITGSFVVKIIWKSWEAFKPWFHWNGKQNSSRASFSTLNVWWSLVLKIDGLPLASV